MLYEIIYKATNKINGKCYIGQTTRDLKAHIKDHIDNAIYNRINFYFHNALSKYGTDSFDWSILCECRTLNDLNKKEIFYISTYNSYYDGYNMNTGGRGNPGRRHTAETKCKISEAKTGVKMSPRSQEWCDKISKAKIGGKLSKEAIEKRTATRKERGYIGSKNNLSKKYVVTTPEEVAFVIKGLKHFCDVYSKTNLSYKAIHRVAAGRNKTHKGYKCRNYNEEQDKNIPMWEYN